MISGIESFNVNPSNIIIADGFKSGLLSPIWITPVVNGTTITKFPGYLKFVHGIGSGVGLSFIRIGQTFGIQTSFEVDVQVMTYDPTATNLVGGIRIWVNADNWFYLGPEIADGANSTAIFRFSVDGVVGTAHFPMRGSDFTNTPIDNLIRRFRIDVTQNHVLVYVNGIQRYDLMTSTTIDTLDYVVELVGGTSDNTKAFDIRMYNFNIVNGIRAPAPYPARFKGVLTLANTTPAELIFPSHINGDMYELVLGADLVEGYMPNAFMLDQPAAFTDITAACNDLTSGDVALLPTIPVVDDGVFFGAAEKFWCVDVYMDGGTPNIDHTYSIRYWNGAWTAIPGVVDGTNGGVAGRTFYQNGRISFTAPADWVTTTVNGITGFFVKIYVTAAGSSVPIATHIQLGFNTNSGFDHAAAFLSTLMIKMRRSFPTAGYTRLYSDAMPYRQCVGERNVDINGWRCDGETKITFELSATPAKSVTIEYFGFTRRL